MKLSRILSLVIAVVILLGVASCAADPVNTDAGSTQAKTTLTDTTATDATANNPSQPEPTETTATEPTETTVIDQPRVEKFEIYYNEEMFVDEKQQITFDVVLSGPWPDIQPEKTFVSSDESILIVDENGYVKALSPGIASITVNYSTLSKSVEITVCGDLPGTSPFIDPYVKKPVIYLYPETPTIVTLTFEKAANLVTTYPKCDGSWTVLADTDGTLTDANGRHYYALFFDEAKTYEVDFSTGFYVTADGAIPFLEEKLALLGFTEREANEFIMFWLPVLERNGQSVVYFEQTAERKAECPIDVSPAPDSVLRVIIHIKKVDAPVEIAEQTLVPFERHGFTLVEWGGTEY